MKPRQALQFANDERLHSFLTFLISCGKIRKKRRRRKPLWNFVIIEYRFSQTLYYHCEGNFASFPQISGHSRLNLHITDPSDNFVHLVPCKPRNYTVRCQKSNRLVELMYWLIFYNWNIFNSIPFIMRYYIKSRCRIKAFHYYFKLNWFKLN